MAARAPRKAAAATPLRLVPSPKRQGGRLVAAVPVWGKTREKRGAVYLRVPQSLLADIEARSFGSINGVMVALLRHAVDDLTQRGLMLEAPAEKA